MPDKSWPIKALFVGETFHKNSYIIHGHLERSNQWPIIMGGLLIAHTLYVMTAAAGAGRSLSISPQVTCATPMASGQHDVLRLYYNSF